MNCRGCGTPEAACIQSGGCCAPCHTNKTLHHTWGRKESPPVVMTAERLSEIREHGSWNLTVRELLRYVDDLTRQRDSARDLAVRSGVFQDHRGEDYDLDSDARGDEWRADPVGVVAWDVQVEQR